MPPTAKKPYTLKFIDLASLQALYTYQGKWHYISVDSEYKPREMKDEAEAQQHHRQHAHYEPRNTNYSSLDRLTNAIRTEFKVELDKIPDVPLEQIIHMLPEKLQRQWAQMKEEKGDPGKRTR